MSRRWPATAMIEFNAVIIVYIFYDVLLHSIPSARRSGKEIHGQGHGLPLNRTVVQEDTGWLMAHFSTAFLDTLLHSFH
jgi:hypothetical protein